MYGNPVQGGQIIHAYINRGNSNTSTSVVNINVDVTTSTTVIQDNGLIGKNTIQVFLEGFFVHIGTAQDECTFDSSTGTITFTTAIQVGQRLSIFGF